MNLVHSLQVISTLAMDLERCAMFINLVDLFKIKIIIL